MCLADLNHCNVLLFQINLFTIRFFVCNLKSVFCTQWWK